MIFKRSVLKNISIVLAFFLAASALIAAQGLVGRLPAAETVSANTALQKLKEAERQGGTAVLNEAELNSLLRLYTDSIKKRLPPVNGISSQLGKEEITILAQISYQEKINLMFSAEGKFHVQEGNLVFVPKAFKIGNILVPKRLVLNKLKEVGGIKIQAGRIIAAKEKLPWNISALAIQEGKIIISFT